MWRTTFWISVENPAAITVAILFQKFCTDVVFWNKPAYEVFPFCIYSNLDRIWRFKGFYCKFSYAVEMYENMEEGKMMRSMINILDKGKGTFKLEFPLMADN